MVSVVIPTYNREKTIKRAVLSVLNQTYEDIEIIIVDDNSSDNTERCIRTIEDARIQYYRLENNKGACYARNYGINKAKGEYIAFQDSDDEWEKEKLEKQLDILKRNNIDITFCSFNLYDGDKFITKRPKYIKSGYVNYDKILEKAIISTQTMIGKRKCFEDEMFDVQMPRFQDWEITLRLSQKYVIYFENEILVKLYSQQDSISKNTDKAIVALEKIMDMHKVNFLKNKRALSNIYIYCASFMGKNESKRHEYIRKGLKTKFDLISIGKIIKLILKK